MRLVHDLGPQHGITRTCEALGVSRAGYYRSRKPRAERAPRPTPPRALTPAERDTVLGVLHEPRFVDLSPGEIHAILLDESTYYCSERTMYRILDAAREVRERRDQARHPHYAAPELLATCPKQLWSWDITRLMGPTKWTYYYLYVIMDVFSRKVVGWMVAHRESAALAEKLIKATCKRQGISRGQLTIHADRGSSMTSKPVALLLADLGVTKTHSRPHVSNDNPYSEAQFRTLKYRPGFPDRFGCIEHARSVCADLVAWYNTEHRHVGLGLLTPDDVHYGRAEEKLALRAAVLAKAHAAHPERFVRGTPRPRALPKEVWINKPVRCETARDASGDPVCEAHTRPRTHDLVSPRHRSTPESTRPAVAQDYEVLVL